MSDSLHRNMEIENNILGNSEAFIRNYKIQEVLAGAGIKKYRGLAVIKILKLIFSLAFLGKNWYQHQRSSRYSQKEIKKDTVYRFLNEARFKWESFLLNLAKTVICKISQLTSSDREKVLIIDDSFYDRARSKKVELLSRVHDHTDNKFKKGFKLLTMGWSDGFSFIPVSFRLLTSSVRSKILCQSEYQGSQNDPGQERRENASKSKPDLLMKMVEEVRNKSIEFQYLLFDSWFAFPKLITRLVAKSVQVIAMLKKMPKVLYRYKGRSMNLKQIHASIAKSWKKSQQSCSVYARLNEKNDEGEYIQIKIVFVRNRNNKADWIALISTDISLSDSEVIRIYGKRWDIEVFFKMSKTYLKLGKEFQGRSYDQMVSHTTIVFLRFMMIVELRRFSQDEKTFGDLFHEYGDEIKDLTFFEALSIIFQKVSRILGKMAGMTKDIIETILNQIILALPPVFRLKLQQINCES
jgi:hypothetical protein